MKIAVLIARILLGLIFVFFGLNGFLNFLHGPLPTGMAGQFLNALLASHYVLVVSALQILGGVLLLAGRYVPLGLTLLGPVIFNVLLYHIFLQRMGFQVAIVVLVLWFIVFAGVRQAFAGIFASRVEVQGKSSTHL